ncbi:OmpA family protein [Variovorax sp. VaC1]|uniref:OmpA family protein n=1 Tax=Variovorax sp. VaC1 TaxID=3373132 RepID=UPI003749EBAB
MPKKNTLLAAVAVLLCVGAFPAAFANDDIHFPALQSSYLKTGDFIGPDHVRRVRPGLNKDQVRLELGNPHFSEGVFGVSEWDYAFNFYSGKGDAYVTCQLKVKFKSVEGEYRVDSTHWKDPDCALFVQPPEVVPVRNVPTLLPPQKVTLNADGLFRFDGSGPADLLPEGKERIVRMAADIQANFKVLHYVTVTGHTDRLGMDAYNLALSQARANTVRDLFVQAGIDRAKVRASGMGKRQPLVSDCEGTRATPELVKCLQPNRRVEIEVVGGT